MASDTNCQNMVSNLPLLFAGGYPTSLGKNPLLFCAPFVLCCDALIKEQERIKRWIKPEKCFCNFPSRENHRNRVGKIHSVYGTMFTRQHSNSQQYRVQWTRMVARKCRVFHTATKADIRKRVARQAEVSRDYLLQLPCEHISTALLQTIGHIPARIIALHQQLQQHNVVVWTIKQQVVGDVSKRKYGKSATDVDKFRAKESKTFFHFSFSCMINQQVINRVKLHCCRREKSTHKAKSLKKQSIPLTLFSKFISVITVRLNCIPRMHTM